MCYNIIIVKQKRDVNMKYRDIANHPDLFNKVPDVDILKDGFELYYVNNEMGIFMLRSGQDLVIIKGFEYLSKDENDGYNDVVAVLGFDDEMESFYYGPDDEMDIEIYHLNRRV